MVDSRVVLAVDPFFGSRCISIVHREGLKLATSFMEQRMTKVTIHGAAGRMGCRLVDIGHQDSAIELVGAVERFDHPQQGADAGVVAGIGELGITIGSKLPSESEVVIDFATHHAVDALLENCLANNTKMVIATTGLSADQEQAIRDAARTLAIVWAPSMSLTVNLAMKLTEIASSSLANQGQRVDVEIIEKHHRFKADAPSGTALRFGEIITERMRLDEPIHGREGLTGERPGNQLGYHAVRIGDNPGEHSIMFGLLGETLELRVAASSRDCYALGAFAAAKFVSQQSPGLYTMYDVLGL